MLRNIVVVLSSAVVALLLVAAGWAAGRFFAEEEDRACLFHDTPHNMIELGLDLDQSVPSSELGRLLAADIRERCPTSVCAGTALSPREEKLVVYVKGGLEALPEDFGPRAKELGSEIRIVPTRFSSDEIQAFITQIAETNERRILSLTPDVRANGIVVGLSDYDPLNTVLIHPMDLISVEARAAVEQVMAAGVPVEFLPADKDHLPKW